MKRYWIVYLYRGGGQFETVLDMLDLLIVFNHVTKQVHVKGKRNIYSITFKFKSLIFKPSKTFFT